MSGARLGPFTLELPVATGGMGVVWRARHRASGLAAAIKVVTPKLAGEHRFQAAFRHEVEAMARLDHPNVIAVYDTGIVPPGTPLPAGASYVAMAWADGGSVATRPPRDWTEVARLVRALLAALGHAHGAGVLHRDLKPANVLRHDNDYLLADFGIARVFREGYDPSGVSGTPAWMAPEQIRGDERAQGPWTDLYALGCLVWHLCADAPAFGVDPQDTTRRKLLGRPAAFVPRLPVPPGLAAWVHGLIAAIPRDRPAFASDALEAFEALGDPTAAGPAGGPPIPLDEDTVPFAPPIADSAAPGDPRTGPPRLPPPTWRPDPPGRPPLPPDAGLGLVGLRPIPWVGRVEERDALWAGLVRVATSGRPEAIAVRGPGGVGKSRLVRTFAARAHERGAAVVLTGRGSGDRIAASVLPFADDASLDALAAIADGDVEDPRRISLIVDALRAAAAVRTPVLVLDDATPAEIEVVRSLLSSGVPALVVVVPTADESLPGLTLGPLPSAELRELLAGHIGLEPVLAVRIEALSAGIPGFAAALVRAWTERGDLVPGPSGHRLAGRVEVPDAILAEHRAMLARSDIHPSIAAAAALGAEVEVGLWIEICAELGLEPSWDPITRGFEAGYMLRRPWGWSVLRPEVLASIEVPPEFHAAAARVLERHGAAPDRVARHLAQSGRPMDAIRGFLQGARVHRRGARYPESLDAVAEAESAASHAGLPEDDATWGHIALARIAGLRLQGDATVEADIAALSARTDAHGWREVRVELDAQHAEWMRSTGRFEDGVALARQALADARRAVPSMVGPALLVLGGLLQTVDTGDEVVAVLEEARERMASDPFLVAQVGILLANLWRRRGDVEAARAELARAERTAGPANLLAERLANMRAEIALLAGDLHAAEEAFRDAFRHASRSGGGMAPLHHLNLGVVLFRRGEIDAARPIVARWLGSPRAVAQLAPAALLAALDVLIAAADGDGPRLDRGLATLDPWVERARYAEVRSALDAAQAAFAADPARAEAIRSVLRRLPEQPSEVGDRRR